MNKIVFSFFLIIGIPPAFAQFSPVSSGVSDFLLEVTYAGDDVAYASGRGGVLIKSTDNGISWNRLQPGVTTDLYSCFFLNKDTGFVAGNGATFLKTMDGGATWNSINLNVQGYDFRGVYFKNSQEGFLIGGGSSGTGGILFRSMDGGLTWSVPTYFNPPIQSVNVVGDLGVLTGSFGTIMTSADGGQSWTMVESLSNQVLTSSVILNDKLVLVTGNSGEILRSVDGGRSFQRIPSNTTDNLFSAFFLDEFTGYIAGGSVGNNTSKILKSIDGGNSWFTIPTNTSRLTTISFGNDHSGLAVGNNGTILKFISNHNTVSGTVFQDANQDCLKDDLEKGLAGIIIKAEPGPYYAATDSTGAYRLAIGEEGTFQISQVLDDRFFTSTCSFDHQSVSFAGLGEEMAGVNFGNHVLQCSFPTVAVNSSRRRRCFTSTTTVSYCNEGTVDAENVAVKVVYPEFVVPISSSVDWDLQDDSLLIYEIGLVKAGECGTILIQDSVVCGMEEIRGLTVCTKASISPIGTCNSDFLQPSPEWDKSSISVTGRCNDGVVTMYIKNAGDGDMTGSHQYRVYVNDSLIAREFFQLASGQEHKIEILADGKTIRLEADQHQKHPGHSRPRHTVEGCAGTGPVEISKGFMATVPADDLDEFIDIDCLPIIDSYDPNDKQVYPAGVTHNNYILKDDILEYLIRFQNTGSDTAYTVIIKDTLDLALDPSSIQMIGSSHEYTWSLNGGSNPVLTFNFRKINLPDSTTNEPESHGFIKFIIAQKENISEGTIIKNYAGIFFDYNSPILTNQTSNQVWTAYPVDFSQQDRILGTTVITGATTSAAINASAFPNPVSDHFQVSIAQPGSYFITIHDNQGRNILQKRVTATGTNTVVDVLSGEFSEGIYQLKVTSDDGRFATLKLVKL